jgi:hypothetical protein
LTWFAAKPSIPQHVHGIEIAGKIRPAITKMKHLDPEAIY